MVVLRVEERPVPGEFRPVRFQKLADDAILVELSVMDADELVPLDVLYVGGGVVFVERLAPHPLAVPAAADCQPVAVGVGLEQSPCAFHERPSVDVVVPVNEHLLDHAAVGPPVLRKDASPCVAHGKKFAVYAVVRQVARDENCVNLPVAEIPQGFFKHANANVGASVAAFEGDVDVGKYPDPELRPVRIAAEHRAAKTRRHEERGRIAHEVKPCTIH